MKHITCFAPVVQGFPMVFWDVVGLWGYLRSICKLAPREPASHVIVAGERGPAVWVWGIWVIHGYQRYQPLIMA